MLLAALLAAATVTYNENPPPVWEKPSPTEWCLFGVAVGLIAIDVGQTRAFLRDGSSRETNPLLGSHPSDLRLVLTAGAATAVIGALWWNLPSPWRSVLLVPVIGAEGFVVAYNAGW